MSRFWLISLGFLASCANSGGQDRASIPNSEQSDRAIHIGGEPSMPMVTDGPAQLAVEVSDISGALEVYLSEAGSELILLPNHLDKTALDFSVESLKEVDQWLAKLHTINKLQAGEGKAGELLMLDGRGDNSVIFAGLYLGEVIRANSALDWNWERFDLFLEANPYFAEHYGQEAGLDVFVLAGPQGVATPINTALKRVVLGREESLHYIGQLLLTEVDFGEALSGETLFGLDRRMPGE